MNVDEFLASWHRLVHEWAQLRQHAGASHALLHDALQTGLNLSTDCPPTFYEQGSPHTQDDALECEMAVLKLSGLVDEAGYSENVLSHVRRPDPVLHFCRTGWRDLINPSLDFDVWWYWFSHLGLEENRVNPLLHYALTGRQAGLSTIQPRSATPTNSTLPQNRVIRRACLFAGFDVDNVVDEYVIRYLAELSRHSDVFYLADSFLSESEMAKLSHVTVDAWAIPHGRYDFGSYAMLAQDLVGWDRLDEYDEVILANDSCYALSSFDHVFARMDSRACDWWGFQASKSDFSASRGHRASIPIAEAKAKFLGNREWRQMAHLHISSYFVALRRPAFQDSGFRRFIGQVGEQPRKVSIVLKYEIGMSRQLIGAGHDFDTFIDKLYPFHPVYNADAFQLIADGFPLLKRTFLVENSTKTPDLAQWKNRVLALLPEAPVEIIERNLERVAPKDQLALSYSVVTTADGHVEAPRLLNAHQMKREDRITPKFEHWWAFPVSLITHQLSSDARAVFEEIRDDPSLKKVILTRSRPVEHEGRSTVLVPLNSPQGQYHLLRAGRILLSDAPADAIPFPLTDPRHLLVDVGGAGLAMDFIDVSPRSGVRLPAAEPGSPTGLRVVSSGLSPLLDPPAMDGNRLRSLQSGFPRADLILRAEECLPADLRAQVDQLRDEVDGRRLVILSSTYAVGSGHSRPSATKDEIALMREWLEHNSAVLGLRENPADRSRAVAQMLGALEPIDLSARVYPHVEVLYRLAHALISDFSPAAVDFLLTGRPVAVVDGLGGQAPPPTSPTAPALARILPLAACPDLSHVPEALGDLLDEPDAMQQDRYSWCRDLFFAHQDDHNAWRVVHGLRSIHTSASTL